MANLPAVDPSFGDDLWAVGFSSDEEDGQSQRECGSHDLDLLACLVEEREGRDRENTETNSAPEMKETFEECLSKPDDVSLMRAKMQAMEQELQQLRQKVSCSARGKRPHTHSQRTANEPLPKKSPPSSVTSSIAMATNSSETSLPRDKPPPRVYDRSVAESLVSQRKSDEENNVTTDTFSGIRIKNPLVSSELMKKRMQGRKMIKVPNISSRVKGNDIEGDWVTVGVVVDKLPPRDSVKGNKYTVWKLSDLSSQSSLVSLFLFGKAYQEHWKMAQGSVVGLLNPTIMPNKETGAVDTSSSQLALSLDMPQKLMPLGTSQDFTVCRAHTKAGRKCTNFANASDGGFCDYHIQGAYRKMRTGRMDCQGGYGPSAGNIHGKLFKNSKTEVFYYGGRSYTAGSRGSGGNLDTGGRQDKRLFAPGVQDSVAEISREMNERKREREEEVPTPLLTGRRVTTSEGGELLQQMLNTQRPGARLLNRHLEQEEARRKKATRPPGKSASELLREGQSGQSADKTSSFQPRLGRGLVPGSVLDLDPRLTQRRQSAARKTRAAAVLREKGKKNGTSEILRRVEENRADTQDHLPSPVEEREMEEGPLSKRRKLDPAEVELILNAKSSHDWAAREVEWEKEEQYFSQREKKENMEQKLSSIKELHVYVSQCKTCNYVAEQVSDLCRKEAHPLARHKAVKRWFECQECRDKACTYNSRYPTFACRKCKSKAFKQTTLFRERKGPKVGSECLLLRGREEKFLQ